MSIVTYKVIIKTKSPFNISTGVKSDDFIKNKTVKDNKGNPYIPGSTIKGEIRKNYRMIYGEEKAKDIFGESGYKPSKVIVDNFYLKSNNSVNDFRFRNAINRYSKVAKDGALFSNEVVYGEFEGEIEVNCRSIEVKDEIFLAIKMINSIGGSKSIGMGRVTVEVEEV